MKFAYGIIALSILLSGCNPAPRYHKHFGEAARSTFKSQIINAEPSNGPQQVDGQTSNSVIDRYHKSYATPPEPVNVFNIGVGSN